MPVSKLDTVYRSLVINKFFTKGWGKPENLKRIFEFRKIVSNRETCYQLVSENYPVTITKEVISSDSVLLEGHFPSPLVHYLPGLVPSSSENAYFQVLLPKKWQSDYFKPVCLHLAGTGDHFFFRRRNLMAKPLLKTAGIGAILLENPFYGVRKPKDQTWSCLHNVSDIFVMGGCLILESLVLFHWCKRNGFGPLGVTGISMGGHMASLAATNWPEPLVLVPCLSWSTASGVFTRGVMSSAIDWEELEHQYFTNEGYSKEIKKMIKIIEDDSFKAGQHFAKHYPESLHHVHKISSDENIKFNLNSLQTTPSIMDSKPPDNTLLEKSIKSQNINLKPFILSKTTKPTDSLVSECITSPTAPTDSNNESKRDALREVLMESNSLEFLQNLDKEKQNGKSEEGKKKIRSYLTWTSNNKKGEGKVKEVKAKVDKEDVKHNKLTVERKAKDERAEEMKREAIQFMCGMMDECTHLTNFSVPVDSELIIAVFAKDDAYVPTDGVIGLSDLWPGAEVRYINAGHVGAFLLHQKVFRNAIVDSFEKLRKKYYSDEKSASYSH